MLKMLFCGLMVVLCFIGCFGAEMQEGGSEEASEQESGKDVTVKVYFMEVTDGMESVVPLKRRIDASSDQIEKKALEALLEGVTRSEQAQGYSSSIDRDTVLNDLRIADGLAIADVSAEIEPAGGSAWVMAIREQIRMTLKQFDTVKEVRILVDGESEDVLQP